MGWYDINAKKVVVKKLIGKKVDFAMLEKLAIQNCKLIYTDEERLAEHCMEGLDADFNKKCKKGLYNFSG